MGRLAAFLEMMDDLMKLLIAVCIDRLLFDFRRGT